MGPSNTVATNFDDILWKYHESNGCYLQNDLSLFFIFACTNSGYCAVAEFIVQSESARDIEEALKVLISWNPEWNPNYFMTDFSEVEILKY